MYLKVGENEPDVFTYFGLDPVAVKGGRIPSLEKFGELVRDKFKALGKDADPVAFKEQVRKLYDALAVIARNKYTNPEGKTAYPPALMDDYIAAKAERDALKALKKSREELMKSFHDKPVEVAKALMEEKGKIPVTLNDNSKLYMPRENALNSYIEALMKPNITPEAQKDYIKKSEGILTRGLFRIEEDLKRAEQNYVKLYNQLRVFGTPHIPEALTHTVLVTDPLIDEAGLVQRIRDHVREHGSKPMHYDDLPKPGSEEVKEVPKRPGGQTTIEHPKGLNKWLTDVANRTHIIDNAVKLKDAEPDRGTGEHSLEIQDTMEESENESKFDVKFKSDVAKVEPQINAFISEVAKIEKDLADAIAEIHSQEIINKLGEVEKKDPYILPSINKSDYEAYQEFRKGLKAQHPEHYTALTEWDPSTKFTTSVKSLPPEVQAHRAKLEKIYNVFEEAIAQVRTEAKKLPHGLLSDIKERVSKVRALYHHLLQEEHFHQWRKTGWTPGMAFNKAAASGKVLEYRLVEAAAHLDAAKGLEAIQKAVEEVKEVVWGGGDIPAAGTPERRTKLKWNKRDKPSTEGALGGLDTTLLEQATKNGTIGPWLDKVIKAINDLDKACVRYQASIENFIQGLMTGRSVDPKEKVKAEKPEETPKTKAVDHTEVKTQGVPIPEKTASYVPISSRMRRMGLVTLARSIPEVDQMVRWAEEAKAEEAKAEEKPTSPTGIEEGRHIGVLDIEAEAKRRAMFPVTLKKALEELHHLLTGGDFTDPGQVKSVMKTRYPGWGRGDLELLQKKLQAAPVPAGKGAPAAPAEKEAPADKDVPAEKNAPADKKKEIAPRATPAEPIQHGRFMSDKEIARETVPKNLLPLIEQLATGVDPRDTIHVHEFSHKFKNWGTEDYAALAKKMKEAPDFNTMSTLPHGINPQKDTFEGKPYQSEDWRPDSPLAIPLATIRDTPGKPIAYFDYFIQSSFPVEKILNWWKAESRKKMDSAPMLDENGKALPGPAKGEGETLSVAVLPYILEKFKPWLTQMMARTYKKDRLEKEKAGLEKKLQELQGARNEDSWSLEDIKKISIEHGQLVDSLIRDVDASHFGAQTEFKDAKRTIDTYKDEMRRFRQAQAAVSDQIASEMEAGTMDAEEFGKLHDEYTAKVQGAVAATKKFVEAVHSIPGLIADIKNGAARLDYLKERMNDIQHGWSRDGTRFLNHMNSSSEKILPVKEQIAALDRAIASGAPKEHFDRLYTLLVKYFWQVFDEHWHGRAKVPAFETRFNVGVKDFKNIKNVIEEHTGVKLGMDRIDMRHKMEEKNKNTKSPNVSKTQRAPAKGAHPDEQYLKKSSEGPMSAKIAHMFITGSVESAVPYDLDLILR